MPVMKAHEMKSKPATRRPGPGLSRIKPGNSLARRWKPSAIQSWLALSSLALIPVYFLLPGLQYLLVAVGTLDGFVTLYMIFFSRRFGPTVKIVAIIISYYTFNFPLGYALGLLHIDTIAVVASLVRFGLQPDIDIPRYFALCLIFKNVFLFFLSWKRVEFDYQKIAAPKITAAEYVLIVIGFVLCFAAWLLSGYGFFGSCAEFYVCLILIDIYSSFRLRRNALIILFIIFASLFCLYVTRSRLPLATLCLYIVYLYMNRLGASTWKTVSIILLTFMLMLGYAFVRGAVHGNGSISNVSQLFSPAEALDANGESGIIYVVGSHVTGLKARDRLPGILDDSIIDKLQRIVPLVPKSKMLADRYMEYYFPAEFAKGGGLAFPLVAEAYLSGGLFAVVVFGFLLGTGLRLLIDLKRSRYHLILFLFVTIRLFRQEIPASLIALLYCGTGAYMLLWFLNFGPKKGRINLAFRKRIFKPMNNDCLLY